MQKGKSDTSTSGPENDTTPWNRYVSDWNVRHFDGPVELRYKWACIAELVKLRDIGFSRTEALLYLLPSVPGRESLVQLWLEEVFDD